jgi:hypothetical protein
MARRCGADGSAKDCAPDWRWAPTAGPLIRSGWPSEQHLPGSPTCPGPARRLLAVLNYFGASACTREGDPGTGPNEAIVFRVGEGEILVNVDGP